jgi:hydroxymethylglutaryl-CoA lyase
LRNTNATISESLERVADIQELCVANRKELVIYISMGFGNPYGDPWNVEIAQRWVNELEKMGIRIFQLSDTIGVANPANIAYLFSSLIPAYPDLEIGAHFHTQPHNWKEKVQTAYENGCRRFDGAIKGFGGCPMAKDDLTGNMPTEHLVDFFAAAGEETGVRREAFLEAMRQAVEVFP